MTRSTTASYLYIYRWIHIVSYWHKVGFFSCPLLPPVLYHLKNPPPKLALSDFCSPSVLGSCCKTILWFALMQCSCWEGRIFPALQMLFIAAAIYPSSFLLLKLLATPRFQYPGKVHAEYSLYYEIVRREGENEDKREIEAPKSLLVL